RGRHGGDQGVQVRRPADTQQLAAAFQLGGDGDRVSRLTAPVQIENAVEHGLMCGPVEVLSPHHLDDVGDGVLGQQHPAEYGLLSRDVLRWLPIEGLPTCLFATVEPDTTVVNQRHPWVPALPPYDPHSSIVCSTRRHRQAWANRPRTCPT